MMFADVIVLGAGPGGYSAAFRAADLGKKVVLIDESPTLGGVCLNIGCIPSKTLLHAALIIEEAKHCAQYGVDFAKPAVDLDKLRGCKNNVIRRLTMGLAGLAKKRKVEVICGTGKFSSQNQIEVTNANGETKAITFENCIIATGSKPVNLPFIPKDERVWDSTSALEVNSIPKKLLVIGGGIIGLEMATVYHALGSKINVVELMNQLIPGLDGDVVKPLQQFVSKKYAQILLNTKVTSVEAKADGLLVAFANATDNVQLVPELFDAVLVAVGRFPNSESFAIEKAQITVDAKGFIPVNSQMQTNIPHIYAIGDVIGNPMLAHKATFEGRLAAEVIAGHIRTFDAKCIPSVAYTDPEVASVGLTENEAKKQGLNYSKGIFPWMASGRSLSLGRNEGMTKLIFDAVSHKVLGGSCVGSNAGELIAEIALAVQNDLTAEAITSTIHPHPTLCETVALAAEAFEGTITDL